jgi:hypothetical protein
MEHVNENEEALKLELEPVIEPTKEPARTVVLMVELELSAKPADWGPEMTAELAELVEYDEDETEALDELGLDVHQKLNFYTVIAAIWRLEREYQLGVRSIEIETE